MPEFWDWLEFQAQSDQVKLPKEILEEVLKGGSNPERDPLLNWLRKPGMEDALTLDEEINAALVQRIVEDGYAADLTDSEIEEMGRDPFLIAYGLVDISSRVIVTSEVSAPSKKRQNRRVPDVCRDFHVQCCNLFEMNRILGFSTSWKSGI